MNIKKLVCEDDNSFNYVTITISCEECRDLVNGLYEYLCLARKNKDAKTIERYKDIYKKISKLFRLVKCGWLLDEDVKYINNTIRDIGVEE